MLLFSCIMDFYYSTTLSGFLFFVCVLNKSYFLINTNMRLRDIKNLYNSKVCQYVINL